MITVEHLSKSFSGKTVLTDVSLRIDTGQTVVILGQSGSGKSVLLKHMIGLLTPDEGRVLVDGVDVHQLPYMELRNLRRQFGVLFQGGALFDSMTAFENVAFPLQMLTQTSAAEIEERVTTCLDMVELPDAGNKAVSELSGGMQKRVALARAIALQPKYIFYDEPNSGLDPQTSRTINELITSLGDHLGVTSVVITHDMRAALDVADHIAFLHGGRVHWQGNVDELHQADDKVLLSFVKASEYYIGHAPQRSGRSFAPNLS